MAIIRQLFRARRDHRDLTRLGVPGNGDGGVGAPASSAAALAQDATPEAGAARDVATLFAQAFHNGNWEPGPEQGTYTLILHGGLASTIYFSDRPERIFGVAPTEGFLDALGFTPDNPPNAALVVNSDGVADIIVIELLDPVYDDAAQNLVYTAKVLEAYHETGLEYLAVQQDGDTLPQEFGAGALFIDDCSDYNQACYLDNEEVPGTRKNWGQCYSYPGCSNCRDYSAECNRDFPACKGKCTFGKTGPSAPAVA